ncbi:MAG: hypothetical protein IPJ41_03890 [Phycisphaerales bacterium]|nr:hypothetical protein [Phycisphaerales bacterium]
MHQFTRLTTTFLLATLCGSAAALAGNDRAPAPEQSLSRAYPGAQIYRDAGRNRILYGVRMTTAATPREAAERFLADHGDAFGAGKLDLVETWSGDVRFGKFYAFSYTQRVGGLDVDLSPGRVLVRNNLDGTWSVVYAAGLFAKAPVGGFSPMAITGQQAVAFIRATEQFGALPKWSDPELVAYQAEAADGFEAVRAWKFDGENPDLINRERYTFFVDAATGSLLEARDGVQHTDVFGYVKGYRSPGTRPDEGGNPPQILPINDSQVSVSGGNSGYSDPTGFFTISHGGSSNVTISANFDTGHWSNVNDQSGTAILTASATATPGLEAYLEFNSSPSQYTTAQANAFVATGLIHNLIRDRTGWTGMDFRCTTNVNLNQTCNAYFDGSSINFFRSGGGCNNSAYSTVVAHEYGHYIVNNQGLGQGSFGEGYGDSAAEMLFDSGIIAEHFYTNGNPIRDNDNTIVTYPCSGEIHYCGQVLGGVWWHMRENFGATYGSSQGLDQLRQLFVDWTIATTGGSGNNSAYPGTAIEVLTLDDNDGDIYNGTPNYFDICNAFELHGIDCPDLVPFFFNYPDGIQTGFDPAGGDTVRVEITANSGFELQPGSGELHLNMGSGFVTYPMTELSDGVYDAVFPGAPCTTPYAFYFSADATSGLEGRDPLFAPQDVYKGYASFDATLVADDNFETDKGWTVTNQNVSSGTWIRGTPLGDGSRAPADDYDGSGQCWLTGDFFGNFDVDGGPTRLTSPKYNIDGLTNPTVQFAYWFYNQPADEDRLSVYLSGDNGASWVLAHAIPHSGTAWFVDSIQVRDFLPDATTLKVRFAVADNPDDSTTEAAIDALLITDFVCDGGCVADFNGDGTVNTQDVLAFLNAWNAGDSAADINGDGSINTQDVLAYLNLWTAGC